MGSDAGIYPAQQHLSLIRGVVTGLLLVAPFWIALAVAVALRLR